MVLRAGPRTFRNIPFVNEPSAATSTSIAMRGVSFCIVALIWLRDCRCALPEAASIGRPCQALTLPPDPDLSAAAIVALST
jgi:hypothetical protein